MKPNHLAAFTLACCLLASTHVGLAGSEDPTTSDWSAEVAEALNLYIAGDYRAAREVCAARLATSRDPRVQRDAAALQAMTMLHMPARNDRLGGRAQLAQLSRQDPSLLERPECLLALGIAHTALTETSKALEYLDEAVEGFAARGAHHRLAEALAALAEAWARHTEWEVTPPRFNVPRPQSSEQARRVRREQVGHVRDRLADVPAGDDALARVDLLLAEDFINAGDRTSDGLRVLEQIASSPRVTPAVAEAIMKLAGHFEQQQHWPEAIALYQRVVAEGPVSEARLARERLAQITKPQLEIDVPTTVPSGRAIRLQLAVRNVDAVRIEVRRVELAPWLDSRQGRFAEALLPEAGSVRMARQLDTSAQRELGWWRSETLADPLEFHAPPGAYVAIAAPANPLTDLRPVKKLMIVSDLTAAVFVGPARATIWATPGTSELTARFWMHGSFVPTEPRFEAGIAHFALPPESRVLRDKRWTCLVQAGEDLALCRGKLNPAAMTAGPSAVALVGGPLAPRVGQELTLAGLILPAAETATDEATWELVVRDTLEQTLFTCPIKPSSAGVFSARVPITIAMDDQHVRVFIRRNGRTVENLRGRFGIKVPPADTGGLVVVCRTPPLLAPPAREVPVSVQAWYPWGIPLSHAGVGCVARGVGLPGPESAGEFHTTAAAGHHAHLSEDGETTLNVSMDHWNLPDGPKVLGIWTHVVGWEGRQGADDSQTLISEQPVCGWLTHEPTELVAKRNARFRLGWFDPTGHTGIERPRLEITSDGHPPIHLRLFPGDEGMMSEPWRPAAAGDYQVVANIPRLNSQPVRVARTVRVLPDSRETDAVGPQVHCEAQSSEHGGQPGVQVRVTGRAPQPMIVLIEAGDPLAAATLPQIDGTSDLFLPLESAPAGARALVGTIADNGVHVLAHEEVRPGPSRALTLHIEPTTTTPLPGDTVRISAACTRRGEPVADATLITRLTPAADSGYLHWLPGQARGLAQPHTSELSISSSRSAHSPPVDGGRADGFDHSPSSARLAEALYEGATLWTHVSSANGELQVPLPELPGLYRLVALAVSPTGTTASDAILLDTRSGLHVVANAPARLTLGDRILVAVMLQNTQPQPADVRVHVDPGPGLHVESLRFDNQTRTPNSAEDVSAQITVPAEGRTWLQLRVEAVAVGSGTLRAEVELAAGRQHATAEYEVLAANPPKTADATMRLRRTLLRLVEHEVRVDSITGEPSEDGIRKTAWRETAIDPGDQIPLGQHLLVREELTVSDRFDAVTWSQRVPPNCHAIQSNSQAKHTVGELRLRRLDRLSFGGKALAVGFHTHEYHIVAVRPGVCQLPAPEVTTNGRPLTLSVEPAELLLNVADTP